MKKSIILSLLSKILLCLLITIILTGCWDRVELDTLGIVMGTGIDKATETDKVKMTVQVAKATEIKSASTSGTSSTTKSYFNVENEGSTILDTVKGFSEKSSRKLLFSHNQVLIFGKESAVDGITKYIDFFLRYQDTRFLVWVLVSDKKANEIFNAKADFEGIPSKNINELMKQQKNSSQISVIDLRHFASRLMSKTTAPVLPLIKLSKEDNGKKIFLSGTAVFKKDKMIGELDKIETRGMLWVIGEVKRGVIVVNAPNSDDKVSLEITGAKSKIKPVIKDGKILMQIKIKEEGNLGEQSYSEDLTKPKFFETLEKEKSSAIKTEILSALKKSRDLNADIFGFGDAIYQHYPKEWKKIEGDWDEVFKNIDVEIMVDAKLRRTGRITKPIMSKQE